MTRFDLRPPPLARDPALDWVLSRAFGPVDAALASVPPTAAERCHALARRLDLAPRIGGRVPLVTLERELGAAAARGFREDHLSTAAREAVLAASTQRLVEHAIRRGAPLVLLKHAALRARHIVGAGLRRAADVDALVPRELAGALRSALLRAGYRDTGAPGHEHQLPPLHDDFSTLIELHVHVPGVRLEPRAGFASACDLIACGLVDRLHGALVPRPPILFAHAVAHAFLQNAGAPQAQSPLKALADLADLLALAPECGVESARFLAPLLDAEELAGLAALARALSSGHAARAQGTTHKLLCHSVASQLDENYAAALRLRGLFRPLSQNSPGRALLAAVAVAAFPSKAAMAEMHGPGRSPLAQARDRLQRPFRLLGRALKGARGYWSA